MRNRLLAAGAVAMMLIGFGVSAAQARVASPAACAGIVPVTGGYKLTTDVVCDFDWATSNQVLNLNHHSLTGYFLPTGTGQTIRNGSIYVTQTEYWANSTNFTASKVKITPKVPAFFGGFMIESGTNTTISDSTISDAPIGLGFYFGDGGLVTNTTFTGNTDGMTIQYGSGVTVQKSTFVKNQTGLVLRNEDSYGVNKTLIKGNTFTGNTAFGLVVQLNRLFAATTGESNTIVKNTFTGSGGSAIEVSLTCQGLVSSIRCPGAGTTITHNTLLKNGTTPDAATPYANDGVTARAVLNPYSGGTAVSYPAGLVGYTVGKNTAKTNQDLGFDVKGVTDGGHNTAGLNGNPAQCSGVVCTIVLSLSATAQATAAETSSPSLRQTSVVPLFIRH